MFVFTSKDTLKQKCKIQVMHLTSHARSLKYSIKDSIYVRRPKVADMK